jgi:plastocyanin
MAGSITGTVMARGPTVASQPAADGAYASMRYKFAEKVDYDHLDDFVIYIDQPVPEPAGAPGPSVATVIQRHVSFEPHVLPIMVGTKVRWPNADDIFHNIFSMSETKDFDLGLYTKDKMPVPEILFDKPGQVDVYCAIHSKMHCIILVLPSRYFTKVSAHQRYALTDVPPGIYRIKAWQERVPPQVKQVTVPAQGEVRVDFTLGLSALPQY